ncbi:Uncharacterised protein [Serratia marcescens]|nr:Uncharacterised protein [Serratia marcescens]
MKRKDLFEINLKIFIIYFANGKVVLLVYILELYLAIRMV